MRLLLISNSTNPGEPYLEHARGQIDLFLKGIDKVIFIPYAAVTISFDEYEKQVQKSLARWELRLNRCTIIGMPRKQLKRQKELWWVEETRLDC